MYKRLLALAAGGVLVLTATPVLGTVVPARDLLPDGDTRPIVVSATLETPKPHNKLLEADLVIDAYDNDEIAGYEYRWSGATIGSPRSLAVVAPTVSYEMLTPDTPYALDVRAIDVNNNASDWYPVWQGNTPGVPRLIVAGDSIASGYSRVWFTGDAACTDAGYSYGNPLASEIASNLPAQWSPTYTNIAWAGAGLEDMVQGGTDSCGVAHESQIDRIRSMATDDTWNIVAVTAGINSTNWTDVIVDLTTDSTFSFTSEGDRRLCSSAVNNTWDIVAKREAISRTAAVVSSAITDGTNARVLWTGYYDITDTEFVPMFRPITGACGADMSYALDTLHGALRSGLVEGVTWVDINTGIGTQKWAGWPHPSRQGQATIAHEIDLALNS